MKYLCWLWTKLSLAASLRINNVLALVCSGWGWDERWGVGGGATRRCGNQMGKFDTRDWGWPFANLCRGWGEEGRVSMKSFSSWSIEEEAYKQPAALKQKWERTNKGRIPLRCYQQNSSNIAAAFRQHWQTPAHRYGHGFGVQLWGRKEKWERGGERGWGMSGREYNRKSTSLLWSLVWGRAYKTAQIALYPLHTSHRPKIYRFWVHVQCMLYVVVSEDVLWYKVYHSAGGYWLPYLEVIHWDFVARILQNPL